MVLTRRQIRKSALEELEKLYNDPRKTLVIHYSCESFKSSQQNSKRITSIAVRELSSGQSHSFSIHLFAEQHQISLDTNYEDAECKMLQSFYAFVQHHIDFHWIHWNMRDVVFGFQAIATRYRLLGGTPIEINSDNLHDLASILIRIYSKTYASHPRMFNLFDMNHISRQDVLSGEQEDSSFRAKDYHKLHHSTLKKVDIFTHCIESILTNTLKTKATFFEIHGWTLAAITGNPHMSFWSTLLGTLFGIIGLILAFYTFTK